MLNRSHNTQNIAWFVDLINRSRIILDPPYQRRSVWTTQYKKFFIDTIMRDYPAPPIFLNSEVGSDGVVKFYVIDGKQRLESIISFVKNEITIPDDFGDRRLDGKYFDELSDDDKKRFWSYNLSVEHFTNANPEMIKDSFERLNRNVLKLTAQELRHAKFEGKFISLVSEIAESPFWSDIDISKVTTIRRMKDIEFISELFLLSIHGIETSSKDLLDDYYVKYDDEIPNEKEIRKKFDLNIDKIKKLDLDIPSTRFVYYSDFFSLWAALLKFNIDDIDFEKTKAKINSFLGELDEEKPNAQAIEYLLAVKSQPNSATKRTKRTDIIESLIVKK